MTDWIDDFLSYTSQANSPEIFRLWAGIGAVSGALERRVWAGGKNATEIYPNLFILLVGPPGSGKTTATSPVKRLWQATKELVVSPDSMTRASLVDEMEKGTRTYLHGKGLLDYHSLLIATDEVGTLIPAYDQEILNVISALYDCRESYLESRRHIKKITDISRPHLTILAGAQPGFLSSVLPETAWTQGFASRLSMIYSGESIISDVLGDDIVLDLSVENAAKFKCILAPIQAMLKLYGKVTWTDDAARELRSWALHDCPPKPVHSKLEHYNRRRALTTVKLSIISAVSRSGELEIHKWDFDRAKHWLLIAETFMPDIFRAMKNKSDAVVIEEMHYMMWELYMKTNKPVNGNVLWHFLKDRVPAEKIQRVIDTACASEMIRKKTNENVYIPLPLAGHGKQE